MAMGDGLSGTPSSGNPYGLSPSMLALQGGLAGLSNAIGPQAQGSSAYMRPAPAGSWSQGQPSADQLLEMILQMRQQAAQGLGDPYQAGVAAPKVSLLGG